MHDVRLLCSSSGEHISQLYAGFAMLAATGEVRARLDRVPPYAPGVAGTVLRAELDGARIVYDTQDHATFPPADLAWATHYFKRSFDPVEVAASDRPGLIHPLGLNYPAYVAGDWRLRRMAWTLRGLRPGNARDVGIRAARLSSIGSRLARAEPGRSTSSVELTENDPEDPGHSIVLLTRTWDPHGVTEERAEMRAAMNRVRVGAIRALRQEFGPRFIGGLAPSADAVRDHPDVVVDRAMTTKAAYTAVMRHAAVCVTSRGLLDTNGWRLAEHLAASRPVVTEPLRHRVPGDFRAGVNHLEYEDPDGVVEAVRTLIDDDEGRARMRVANERYYRHHVRPDALIRRTLEVVSGTGSPEHAAP